MHFFQEYSDSRLVFKINADWTIDELYWALQWFFRSYGDVDDCPHITQNYFTIILHVSNYLYYNLIPTIYKSANFLVATYAL